MKILFLTTHINTGGITSYLYTLANSLILKGHKVYLVSSGGNMENTFESIGVRILNKNIFTKSELNPKIYFLLPSIKKFIDENQMDIIHAHTRITQVLGTLLSKLTGVPLISTCHGFFKPKFSRRIFPCWGRVIVAISNAVQKHLIDDFKINSEKVIKITSGIDLEKFPLVDDKLKKSNREKYDLKDEPVIGVVARLSDVKGQDILINAMPKIIRKMPEIKLLIIGRGKYENYLKNIVSKLNIDKNVIFIDMVNNAHESLSLLDLFVAPSRQEGLGISIMEAQASGLCVVASNIGGIPDLIQDGKTGFLVRPEDHEELADVIIKIFDHKNRIKQIGLLARQHAIDNYSSEKMVDKIIRIYSRMVEK